MAGSVAHIAASRKVVEKSIAPQRNEQRADDSFPKLLDNARNKPEPAPEQKNTTPTKRPKKAERAEETAETANQETAVDEAAENTDVTKTEDAETEPVAQEDVEEVEEPVVDEVEDEGESIEMVVAQPELPVMAMIEVGSPVAVFEQADAEESDAPAEGESNNEKPTAARIAMPVVAKPEAKDQQFPSFGATSKPDELKAAETNALSDVKVTLPGELAPESVESETDQPADTIPQPVVKSSPRATEATEAASPEDEAPEQPATSTSTSAMPAQQHQQAGTTPVATPDVAQVQNQPSAPTPVPANVNVPQPPAETRFAEVNHPKIISSVQGTLLPRGGTMQIRLDPPELGALNVIVKMHDGLMTAQFQTSNEEATKLLSHSLNLLKHSLESQGVTIDKLQVQQAPRDMRQDASTSDQQRDPQQQQQQNDEQQRREMLRRMWRRLANGSDPLDLVA